MNIHLIKKYIEDNQIEELCRYLSQFGDASIDQPLDYIKKTALMEAARSGNTALVQALLNHGADVNRQTDDGWTALMYAARFGWFETAQCLIQAGADLDKKTKSGYTALMIALSESSGHPVAMELIQKGADLEIMNDLGLNIIMMCSQKGLPDLLSELLKKPVDLNLKCKSGFTALMYNGRSRQWNEKAGVKVLKLLTSKGADVNAQGPDKKYILNYLIENDNYAMVNDLITSGADPWLAYNSIDAFKKQCDRLRVPVLIQEWVISQMEESQLKKTLAENEKVSHEVTIKEGVVHQHADEEKAVIKRSPARL